MYRDVSFETIHQLSELYTAGHITGQPRRIYARKLSRNSKRKWKIADKRVNPDNHFVRRLFRKIYNEERQVGRSLLRTKRKRLNNTAQKMASSARQIPETGTL